HIPIWEYVKQKPVRQRLADDEFVAATHRDASLVQSSMASTPRSARRAKPSFIARTCSALCPTQSVISPITRNGDRERNDFVGFPGNRWLVRFGSSSMGPVGSTM